MGMSREDSMQGNLKASGLASGQITPTGDGFWDNFMTDGSWEDDHAGRSLHGSVGDDGSARA